MNEPLDLDALSNQDKDETIRELIAEVRRLRSQVESLQARLSNVSEGALRMRDFYRRKDTQP